LIVLTLSILAITSCQTGVATSDYQPVSSALLNESCTTFFASNGDIALLCDSEDMGADHPLASFKGG